MNYLKKHWKQIAGILAALLVVYLLYRWYQSNQAQQQSTADSTATDPTANAEYQAIANALQAQGLGSAASGSIVTPSVATPASGGMTPSSPSVIPDNSGQLMSTVQGSLPQNAGGGVATIQTPSTGYGDATTGYYSTPQSTNVPNPSASGVGMNTAQAQVYTPNTYTPTPDAGTTSYAPQIQPTRGSGGTATPLTATRGGGGATATRVNMGTAIFGGARGTTSAAASTPLTASRSNPVASTRVLTIAPNKAPASTATTVNRSSLASGARRA